MSLLAKLQDDLKDAMKAGDVTRRETLRLTISALKMKNLELERELSTAEELSVLQKEVKKRHESIAQYVAGKREDLAAKERAEIAVLARYLPEEMNEDEARSVVKAAIAKLGVSSKKDLGQVMKAVLAEHKGKVDGKLVQRLASELLT
jgi:uncharacterized protein YqeY